MECFDIGIGDLFDLRNIAYRSNGTNRLERDGEFAPVGIENIIAKADTGARRSAIDVKNIEELPGDKCERCGDGLMST